MNQVTVSESTAWFSPFLVENNHQACDELLQDAKSLFLSDKLLNTRFVSTYKNPVIDIAGMKSVDYETDPDISVEERGSIYSIKIPADNNNGKTYYLHPYRHPGCGGACERYQLLVSEQIRPDDWNELVQISPPAASNYSLFKDVDKSFWLFLFDNSENLLTYKLIEDGIWKKTCEIRFHPEALYDHPDPYVQRAYNSLQQLKEAVRGLTRYAGSCGSMRTHRRWASYFANILPVTLYRPWSLKENHSGFYDEYGTYERDIEGLNDWALTGISEYISFNDYLAQLEKTIKVVADFYQNKFGWAEGQSRQIARTAITTAVSTTIRFYHYEPFKSAAEKSLHKAILEKQSINKIKTLIMDVKGTEYDSSDNLLTVAVMYPEALQYLLESGLDPNYENGFGKTALMYAVQYNQYESAKLLLEAGANPNAKTTSPVDRCYYTLNTFNMTALHYAIRYASSKLIKLLLDSGAETFIEATREYPRTKETPLDWLSIYTQKHSDERNTNIQDEEVVLIKGWLQTHEGVSPASLANDYILQAERLYHQNNLLKAYEKIGLALEIQPNNELALSDMSLIALKNGKLGRSLEASQKLIVHGSSDKMKANAWFNQGLACEKYLDTGHNNGYLPYNGKYYCKNNYLYSFYKSFKTEPTTARKNKIYEIFSDSVDSYCAIFPLGVKINFQAGSNPDLKQQRMQTLFVLHKTDAKISGEDLSWNVEYSDAGNKHVIPQLSDAINLGKHTLSVFQTGEALVHFPYEVFGYRCNDGASMAIAVTQITRGNKAYAYKVLQKRNIPISIEGLIQSTRTKGSDSAYHFNSIGFFDDISEGDLLKLLRHISLMNNNGRYIVNDGLYKILNDLSGKYSIASENINIWLYSPIEDKKIDIAMLLLKFGAIPETDSMMDAAYIDDYHLIASMIDAYKNAKDIDVSIFREPVVMAAQLGNLNAVKAFVDSNKVPMEYLNKSFLLAALNDQYHVVRYLINIGVDINHRDRSGCTALHYLSGDGTVEIIKHLLESGANINVSCRGKQTPLHWAYEANSSGVIELLVENGAITHTD